MNSTIRDIVKRRCEQSALIVLVFLTLLVSCPLRKAFQVHTGAPVTKQLNPYKATVAGEQHCDHSEIVAFSEHNKEVGFELPVDYFPSFSYYVLLVRGRTTQQPVFATDRQFATDKVPFYILYNKLKVFISDVVTQV